MTITINTFTVNQLNDWLQNTPNHVNPLIDVRELNELEEHGKIKGAINIPFGLSKSNVQLFESMFLDLDKEKQLVLSCRSGRRSMFAAEYVTEKLGFKNVYNVQGGLLAWIENGYPAQAFQNNHSAWIHPLDTKLGSYIVVDTESRDALLINRISRHDDEEEVLKLIQDQQLNLKYVIQTTQEEVEHKVVNHDAFSKATVIDTNENINKSWIVGRLQCWIPSPSAILIGDALFLRELEDKHNNPALVTRYYHLKV
ncbi:Rhodanese-like protein [Backusella circina FSU 941]|nr:Rhodanese-like protein [Backusella circina FSU 941]